MKKKLLKFKKNISVNKMDIDTKWKRLMCERKEV